MTDNTVSLVAFRFLTLFKTIFFLKRDHHTKHVRTTRTDRLMYSRVVRLSRTTRKAVSYDPYESCSVLTSRTTPTDRLLYSRVVKFSRQSDLKSLWPRLNWFVDSYGGSRTNAQTTSVFLVLLKRTVRSERYTILFVAFKATRELYSSF